MLRVDTTLPLPYRAAGGVAAGCFGHSSEPVIRAASRGGPSAAKYGKRQRCMASRWSSDEPGNTLPPESAPSDEGPP